MIGSEKGGEKMSRYIDADHLIWRATTYYNPNGKTEEEMYPRGWDCTCQTESDFVEYVNEEPSIDLDDYVPRDYYEAVIQELCRKHTEEIESMPDIVRCSECKHWVGNISEDDGIYEDECKWITEEAPNADDFCSYGERKE